MPAPAPKDHQSRIFAYAEFDAARLVAAKSGRIVSVCIPARNEAATIGPIVQGIVSTLTSAGGGVPLVDDVVVVDDGSTDGTAAIASSAGARVISGGVGRRRQGPGHAGRPA